MESSTNQSEILYQVKSAISRRTKYPIAEIKDDLLLTKDLGMDSLDIVETVIDTEIAIGTFQGSETMPDIPRELTVLQLCNYIGGNYDKLPV